MDTIISDRKRLILICPSLTSPSIATPEKNSLGGCAFSRFLLRYYCFQVLSQFRHYYWEVLTCQAPPVHVYLLSFGQWWRQTPLPLLRVYISLHYLPGPSQCGAAEEIMCQKIITNTVLFSYLGDDMQLHQSSFVVYENDMNTLTSSCIWYTCSAAH